MPVRLHVPGSFSTHGAVVEALEGYEFDGLGQAVQRCNRLGDHQCFKDVVVVRGKENPENEFDLRGNRRVNTSRSKVTYERSTTRCLAGGALGDCNPGRLNPSLRAGLPPALPCRRNFSSFHFLKFEGTAMDANSFATS